jgi:hypothetical protein
MSKTGKLYALCIDDKRWAIFNVPPYTSKRLTLRCLTKDIDVALGRSIHYGHNRTKLYEFSIALSSVTTTNRQLRKPKNLRKL